MTRETKADKAKRPKGRATKSQRAIAAEGKTARASKAKAPVREQEAEDREERFDVEIFRAWCKGCGICVAFCPQGVLAMNEKGEPVVSKPELCIGCAWCELRCPDFAINVKEKREEVCEA